MKLGQITYFMDFFKKKLEKYIFVFFPPFLSDFRFLRGFRDFCELCPISSPILIKIFNFRITDYIFIR